LLDFRIHDQETTEKIVKAVIDPISKEYFEESRQSLLNKLFNLEKNNENVEDNINKVEKVDIVTTKQTVNDNIEELKAVITFEESKPKSYMRKSNEIVFPSSDNIETTMKSKRSLLYS
jgi:hypothetical protein